MALIVEYHVVADMYPVGTGAITAGMGVTLDAGGLAVAAPITTVGKAVFGIAGDSALAVEGQTTAYSASLTIGADGGGSRWSSNRVSDFYDETTASQKITVYNGGGKFWISDDLFDTGHAVGIGTYIEPSTAGTAGEWDDNSTAGAETAIAVGASQAYPSGVPGTDTTDGSITLGDYIPVVLRV
jgi:hypothetical protein